jgi:tetratricopeptide (TPR) repeat protein
MQNSDGPPAMLRTGLIALCAAALLSAFSARADELQDASKLLRAGQPQQAMERVNRVLASKPRDAQARFLKGLIHTDQGNTKEAIEVFTKLTQDYPELPEPYNNLAVLYAGQGQYEKARTALEQSIRTHPSYATAYENLGDVYAKLASQAYDKALQLDSSNRAAQNKLSLVRELVGPATASVAGKITTKEQPKPPVAVAQNPPDKPVGVEKPAPVAPDDSKEVVKALNAWAQAWSKKDVEGYLSHYAKDFRTPKGEQRAQWEKDRRTRISAPKSIAVSVASPKVTMTGSNQANVTFRQTYRSDVFKGTSTKTLLFVRQDGRWLIQQEKAG